MDDEQLYEMHKNMYEMFMKQDYENEYFDVIFYVDGRKLYAHSAILAYESTVFKKQFIKNHLTRNEPIQINDDFTYDEFFAFIRLFYLISDFYGDVDFDNTHIIAFYKMAHIYGASDRITKLCYDLGNIDDEEKEDIFEFLVYAQKHSLKYCESDLSFDDIIEDDNFVNLDKTVVIAIVDYFIYWITFDEYIYKMVYKWGEHQAMITVEMPEDEKNQLIFHYIKDFLPYFSLKYLLKVFVQEKGLISVNEANKSKIIEVKIKSGKKSITGSFVDGNGIYEIIKSHENEMLYYYYRGDKERSFWRISFDIPSIQSSIKKRDGIEWYLLFDEYKNLCIKHHSKIKTNDYLIAEMKASNENESDGSQFMFGTNTDVVYATVSRKY